MTKKRNINKLELDECNIKPVPNKKGKYEHKFQMKWLTDSRFASWISPSKTGINKAYCRACCCELKGSVTLIRRHGDTSKHLKNIKLQNKLGTLNSSETSVTSEFESDIANAEMKLCNFVAEHNLPIDIMGHLSELVADTCSDSRIATALKSSINGSVTDLTKIKTFTSTDSKDISTNRSPQMEQSLHEQSGLPQESIILQEVSPTGNIENSNSEKENSQSIEELIKVMKRLIDGNLIDREEDGDKLFILSLLPLFRQLHVDKKIRARLELTQVLQRLMVPSSSIPEYHVTVLKPGKVRESSAPVSSTGSL